MTAPGDNIDIPQNAGTIGFNNTYLSPLGGDPDDFPGVTRLDTGYDDRGNIIAGTSTHSGVFEKDTDAFRNVQNVVDGGNVTLYNPRIISGPHVTYVPEMDDNAFLAVDRALTEAGGSFIDSVFGIERSESDYEVLQEERPRTRGVGN